MITDDQYWLAQDPRARVLDPRVADPIQGFPLRELKARELYNAGLNPDGDIWICGWQASRVMEIRELYYKLPWVPNAFQPMLRPDTDMSKPWDRCVRTSIDPNDYPAFEPPAPPAPAPLPSDDIGPKNGDTYTASYAQVMLSDGKWKYAEGTEKIHDGQPLYFVVAGGFIPTPLWLTKAQYDKWKATGTV